MDDIKRNDENAAPNHLNYPYKPVVLAWDHSQQPNLEALGDAIHELSRAWVQMYVVDTGSDEYAIVLARDALFRHEVADLYRRHLEGEPVLRRAESLSEPDDEDG